MDGVPTESYDYDANGNRIEVLRDVGGGDVAMYDAQDRLNVYDAGGEVFTYDHTAGGELRAKTGPTGTTWYQYDLLGALTHVALPDGTQIDYLIDPRGRRIGKQVNGILQWGLLYQDALNPVAQLDAAGNLVSTFVYGTRPNVPDFFYQKGRTYRIIADHLGSPRLVIDAADGTIAERIDEEESYSDACYVDPSAPQSSDGASNGALRALKDSLKPKPPPPDSFFAFTFGFAKACAYQYFPKYGPKYPPPPVPLPKR